ncbi:MAG: hypothetical protein IT222_00075 [Crocinitomix sp.]|nr:hypothetical protein [Crocinitomix sp.]
MAGGLSKAFTSEIDQVYDQKHVRYLTTDERKNQDFAKGMVLAARILVDAQLVGIETKIRLKGTAR